MISCRENHRRIAQEKRDSGKAGDGLLEKRYPLAGDLGCKIWSQ